MNRRQEIIELLGGLIAARTENPPGNESAAVAVAAEYLDGRAVPYRVYEKETGRGNIVASVGSGAPVLLVACHLDTVPAGGGWSADPFVLRMDGDKAYGRGAADNKGAFAASLVAAAAVKEGPARRPGTFMVAGMADEERGNVCGARYLLEEVGLKADFAIVPDSPTRMEMVDVGEKGVIFLRVRSYGKAAHGSMPELGFNAIVPLADLARRLAADKAPTTHGTKFTPGTMNVGTISGGTAANVVPDGAELGLDFRIVPGTDLRDVTAFVGSHIAGVCRDWPGARLETETVMFMPPHEVPLDSPLVKFAQQASEKVFKRRLAPLYQGGVTLAKEFHLAGIGAIAVGPGGWEAVHTPDECVEISELESFAEFLVAAWAAVPAA